MLFLAYLIAPPSSAWQEVSAQDRPNRILLGLRKTDEGDKEHLRRFSEILLNLGKGEHSAPPPTFRMDTNYRLQREPSTLYTNVFRLSGTMTRNTIRSTRSERQSFMSCKRTKICDRGSTAPSGPSTLKMTCCVTRMRTVAVKYHSVFFENVS
jgi:hypothetical protein